MKLSPHESRWSRIWPDQGNSGLILCKKGARNTEALGKLRACRWANPALAIEDIGKGRHGDARTTSQLGLGQGMLLHEVAEPVNGCEIVLKTTRSPTKSADGKVRRTLLKLAKRLL